eukprot:UN26743
MTSVKPSVEENKVKPHHHAFGKKGYGPNSRYCVLCKPEYPIYNADGLVAQQFRTMVNNK